MRGRNGRPRGCDKGGAVKRGGRDPHPPVRPAPHKAGGGDGAIEWASEWLAGLGGWVAGRAEEGGEAWGRLLWILHKPLDYGGRE